MISLIKQIMGPWEVIRSSLLKDLGLIESTLNKQPDPSTIITTGVTSLPDLTVEWDQVDKAGSSLGDLATKSASDLTSGTLPLARGGTGVDLSSSGGTNKILAQDASHVISARDFNASDVVAGQLALARGGTNADLSATGGASQYLKQSSSGAAITVGQPATTDLSDYATGTFTPSDGSGAGLSFSAAIGNYTKIGRVVFAMTVVVYPTTASGLTAKITGFPFTVNAGISNQAVQAYTGGGPSMFANYLANTTTCVFSLASGTGSATNAQLSGFPVIFMGIYFI